jgi:protein SCO1/2
MDTGTSLLHIKTTPYPLPRYRDFSRNGFRWLALLLLPLACAPAHAGDSTNPPAADTMDHSHHHMQMEAPVRRSVASYPVPAVTLRDQHGRSVVLSDLLDAGGKPVMLNFIYTSCRAICPMLSALFAQVQKQLGDNAGRVHMVSISIDPEQDSPAVLAGYAARFGAGPQWEFLTGSLDDSIRTQQAFDAYRGDKMNHAPLTLLRATPGSNWVRYDGFASADTLTGELRGMLSTPAAATTGNARTAESRPVPLRGRGFNDDFAKLNAMREGVVVLPSGVQYEVLTGGDGNNPRAGDTVVVNYTGTLTNGVVFDSHTDRNKPAHLPLDKIAVPGLREALLLMKEGATWRVVVPPAMGYGRSGNNMLRKRDLIYEISLLGIEATGKAAADIPATPVPQ